jgi:hypothetical protein
MNLWIFLLAWITATAIACAIGAVLGWLSMGQFAVVGLFVGLAQYLLLRPHLKKDGWLWILLTAFGMVLPPLVGVMQWLVLREQQFVNCGRWIITAGLAWSIAAFIGTGIAIETKPYFPHGYIGLIRLALGGLGAGLFAGLITGIDIMNLIKQKSTESSRIEAR